MSEAETEKVKIRTTQSLENEQQNTSVVLKEGELHCFYPFLYFLF